MPVGQGPVTFTWKVRLADCASGTISLTVPLHCLLEPLDLHADALADLEPVRQRLAHAGHQLHPLGIEERDQHLARRDHVAHIDLLVDDGSVDGRADGGPIERGLHFVDGLLGSLQVRLGGSQRRGRLLVLLPADGVGLHKLRIALLIGGRLRADGFGGRDGRLGLLELGPQIGVVQAHQDIAGFAPSGRP